MTGSKLTPGTILLDIEGTTTSISFVKEVLFPYAREHLEKYLEDNWTLPETQEIVQCIRKHAEEDVQNGLLKGPLTFPEDVDLARKEILENLLWQMDNDRKTTGLKSLQGKIWMEGYSSGVLKSHVYEDVPEAFKKWTEAGKKLYIYSSGSVQAQILLFKYSSAGDLTQYISGYFDTTSGPKIEAESYKNISEKIGTPPKDILFLTDIPKESYAALSAGLSTVILLRPGNAPLTSKDEELQTVKSFNEFIL